MKNPNDRFSEYPVQMLFQVIASKSAPLVDARGVTMGVAKNVIFRRVLHWPIRMWHPHLPSNVKRRSANQKIFRLCLEKVNTNSPSLTSFSKAFQVSCQVPFGSPSPQRSKASGPSSQSLE